MSTKAVKTTNSRKVNVKENIKENLKMSTPVKQEAVSPMMKQTKVTPVEMPTTPVVEMPVTPVVEMPATPVVEIPTTPVAEQSVSIRQRLDVLIKNRMNTLNEIKMEILELKKLQKDYDLELKNALKKQKKRKSSEDGVKRKPSGFASPVVVSDALYSFLSRYGVKAGEPIARTDVTRHITNYISEHNLQNPQFRREIHPDETLKSLFGEPIELKDKTDANSPLVYTYLQLQRYLSPHFPKKMN
jgi:upstream activation factor subunit UAF30